MATFQAKPARWKIRSGSQRTCLTPIIFLTANEQSQDAVIKGYASGAVDYLFKPFDPQILKPKVQALLEHQRNRRALQRLSHDLEVARALYLGAGQRRRRHPGRRRGRADPAAKRRCRGCSMPNCKTCKARVSGLPAKATYTDLGRFELLAGYKRGETLRLHDALLRTAPGQQVPVALSCAPLPSEQCAMVVTVLDMSVVRHLHQQLEFQAVTDPLTGLLNRRGFIRPWRTCCCAANVPTARGCCCTS